VKRVRVDFGKIAANEVGGSSTVIYAERIALLRARAQILTGKDKVLMEMYLKNGSTFRQMSRLAGVSEKTIARRIHKLIGRLLDGRYIGFVRKRGQLDLLEQGIARDYFMEGLSQKKIALKRGIGIYRVRKSLKKIKSIEG
jgi:DNA-directed RNA polymerase specialized sigma subunit